MLFLKDDFADRRMAFVKNGIMQFTKRELRDALRSPLLWAALAAATVVLGIAGPFRTYEALSLPARLAYWGGIAVSTYLTGFLLVTTLNAAFSATARTALRDGVFGALAGIPVAGLVWLANLWVFPGGGLEFPALLAYVVVVGAVATATITFFWQRLDEPPRELPLTGTGSVETRRPPLLDRLPVALRGRIYHLSMQDHYVEVVTDKGSHLVLMRMSDAIAETAPVDGLQIHRSHWVAREAVSDSVRRGERLALRLVNGTELPVSRSNLSAVREAGLG